MTEGLIREALDQFHASESGSDFNREAAYEDIKFARLGDQWPDHVRAERQAENRPCLTVNKLPTFIRQVVNDARQAKPGIIVSPAEDGEGDEDTAHVVGGLIRSIERKSQAEVAYDTSIDHAVTAGWGAFEISIEYAHSESFDLECRINRIANPLMLHWDTYSTEFDGSDWNYAFLSDLLSKEEFKRRYPKATPVSFEGDTFDGTLTWQQGVGDGVRIAKYWRREEAKRKILQLRDPMTGALRVMRLDSIMDRAREIGFGGSEQAALAAFQELTGVEILREREATYHKVVRHTISGREELEEAEPWPGETIPVVPVWGDEVIVDGRRYLRSMIREARDPQAMFNFWRTASTELVALAPRAPFMVPRGAIPDDELHKWESANTRSWAFLEWESDNGQLPMPQRMPMPTPAAGMIQEALNANEDIKAVTGIFDPSLGQRSNETSGRAIIARQRESDVSNFHFIDNLNRAIARAGRILVDVIPAVYGPRQTVRILGDDKQEQVVRLTQEDGGPHFDADGETRLYNLNTGRYDVTVSAGPSYATQREEARETFAQIMQAAPQTVPLLADLLLDQMDFVGADKAAERMRAFMAQTTGLSPDGAPPATPMGGPVAPQQPLGAAPPGFQQRAG